jgi:galactokinase
MITPQMATFFAEPTYLQVDPRAENSDEFESKLYTLYFAEANASSGGDGHISTMVPESGGQSTSSALDSTIEFTTGDLLSSLEITGRPKHGSSSGQFYIPVHFFLRAQGLSNF